MPKSEKLKKLLETIREYSVLTLGTWLTCAGIYFFKFPNHFNMGGVSGLSVVLEALSPELSAGGFVFIINMALLLIGFLVVGSDFGVKTAYCSILFSVTTLALEYWLPLSAPLTSQPLLELVISVLLPGIGSAVLFNYGASNGGTDIIAMIIKKYTGLNISRALICADIVIVLSSVFVFDTEIVLMSLLGFAAKALVVNNVVESLNTSKFFTIITDERHGHEIAYFITHRLHKSATVNNDYEGAFTNTRRTVILAALTRNQALVLRKKIKDTDPSAFIVINNTSDIIGRGFRETI